MKSSYKMSVREMDRVNDLIDVAAKISRLNLSESERALAYFRYIQTNAPEDFRGYAHNFDELIRGAENIGTLTRIRECALAARRELTDS